MTTNEIRTRFLTFFNAKNHSVIESDSLVPKDDPTVLFTTAGMQQFKRQFLGYIDGYTRAATSQKCLRTDDLDKVGKTDFHHTFFEMLGNFSFGDYFKKEAIIWGWEFLTEELKIPKEKLWVSVYKDDTQAREIWIKEIKIDPKKVVALGDHSNFWPADAKENGPNGPCGPCSEIFFDYGVNPNCKSAVCDPDCSCGRFSEIWNLVFTQFNRKDGGVLEPLPSKNIDTGMGLERLVSVMQGKKSNFDTDLFEPILKAIDDKLDLSQVKADMNLRFVLADHLRAIVFGIADGVVPSNEGRGYVIKKLIIDIADIALRSGEKGPTIYKLIPSVVDAMKAPYPYLTAKEKDIASVVEHIEKSYIKVRKERLPEFEKKAKDCTDAEALGDVLFTYRDTFGLALNTMEQVLKDLAFSEEKQRSGWQEFQRRMEEQQNKSRASSKMTGDVFTGTQLKLDVPKTNFIGYDHHHATSTILKIFVNDAVADHADTGSEIKLVLDKTPFYAESGGQVGDTGIIIKDNARISISDTQKMDDVYVHIGKVEKGIFKNGDVVEAQIDLQRRMAIMRNHTATHLLQAALREVLGGHIKQQGSLVAEDRLRFDFAHPKAITSAELKQIERCVNEMILSAEAVTKEYMDIEQARDSGALAFFAEKYGKVVRVVSIGEYSKEFCGGTHLNSIGQIGLFKITSESAVAQGIRRLEARTGLGALDYVNGQEKTLDDIAKAIKSSQGEILNKVQLSLARMKTLEKEHEKIQLSQLKGAIDSLVDKAQNFNGTKVISHIFADVTIDSLKQINDMLKQKTKSAVIVLGARADSGAALLISVSDDLIKKGIKANEMAKDLAPIINGNGGGRPQLAQAGSKDTSNLDKALEQANVLLEGKLS